MAEAIRAEKGVPIVPETLRWAMERMGLTPGDIAKTAGVKFERVQAWLEGKSRPTHVQTHKVARRLGIGFLTLLLPPEGRLDHIDLPDFRHGPRKGERPSPTLLAVIRDVRRKSNWYADFRREPNRYVGKFAHDRPEAAAAKTAEELGVRTLRDVSKSWTEFLERLSDAIEDRFDILVLRNYVLGNNTKRPLDPEEFSGFSITGPGAPALFVNTAAKAGSIAHAIFTLAHELGHVLRGEPGLDDETGTGFGPRVERFCDAFAAALLMPKEEFHHVWARGGRNTFKRCQGAAKHFKVSARACLYRAAELRLIGRPEVEPTLEAIREAERLELEKPVRGRLDFYSTQIERKNSRKFVQALMHAVIEGEEGYTRAASLLGVRLDTLLEKLDRWMEERRGV